MVWVERAEQLSAGDVPPVCKIVSYGGARQFSALLWVLFWLIKATNNLVYQRAFSMHPAFHTGREPVSF